MSLDKPGPLIGAGEVEVNGPVLVVGSAGEESAVTDPHVQVVAAGPVQRVLHLGHELLACCPYAFGQRSFAVIQTKEHTRGVRKGMVEFQPGFAQHAPGHPQAQVDAVAQCAPGAPAIALPGWWQWEGQVCRPFGIVQAVLAENDPGDRWR
jgi:hypothetical protein